MINSPTDPIVENALGDAMSSKLLFDGRQNGEMGHYSRLSKAASRMARRPDRMLEKLK
jgi:hypothetical protein